MIVLALAFGAATVALAVYVQKKSAQTSKVALIVNFVVGFFIYRAIFGSGGGFVVINLMNAGNIGGLNPVVSITSRRIAI